MLLLPPVASGEQGAGGPSSGYHGHYRRNMVGDGAAEAWQQCTAAVGVDATPAWWNCEGCGGSGFLLRLRWCPGRGLAHVSVMWG